MRVLGQTCVYLCWQPSDEDSMNENFVGQTWMMMVSQDMIIEGTRYMGISLAFT